MLPIDINYIGGGAYTDYVNSNFFRNILIDIHLLHNRITNESLPLLYKFHFSSLHSAVVTVGHTQPWTQNPKTPYIFFSKLSNELKPV